MISKETFINTITKLEKLDHKMDDVDKSLRTLSPDFGGFYIPDIFDIVINILRDIFQDKDDWLSYFVFERNWLHNFEVGDIEIDGKAIEIRNWEDVYDFITGE